MAITLVSRPTSPASATRPCRWVFTSNTAGIAYLIVQPVIDSVVYPTQNIEADSSGEFSIDLSQFIQSRFNEKARTNSYSTSTLDASPSTATSIAGAFANCYVNAWEAVESSGTITTAYPGSVDYSDVATIRYFLNATRQHDEAQNFNSYLMGTSSGKFLTHAPTSKVIGSDEHEMLYAWVNDIANFDKIRFKLYSSDGTLINTTTMSLTPSANTVIGIPVGTSNNSAYFALHPTMSYYTIELTDAALAQTSETRTYIVDSNGCFSRRIHWKNPFGVLDSFSFQAYYEDILSSEKQTYEKFLPYSFNSKDRGEEVLRVNARESMLLRSHYIVDSDREWLKSILTSTDVYLEDGSLYPVIVTSGQMTFGDFSPELKFAEIELRYANKVNTHIG